MAVPPVAEPFATAPFTLCTPLSTAEYAARRDQQTLGWLQLKGLFGTGRAPNEPERVGHSWRS